MGSVVNVTQTQADWMTGTLTGVEATNYNNLQLQGIQTIELIAIQDAPIQQTGANLTNTSSINYGSVESFAQNYYCDYTNGSPILYKFDISQLPDNIIITNAYFSAYYWDAGGDTSSSLSRTCRAITSDWDESTVTWNTRPSWDSINRGSISQPINGGSGWYNSGNNSLTQLVSEWYSGSRINYGLVTIRTSCTTSGGGDSWRIHTYLRETNTNKKPKLVVQYRVKQGIRISPQINVCSVGQVVNSSIEWIDEQGFISKTTNIALNKSASTNHPSYIVSGSLSLLTDGNTNTTPYLDLKAPGPHYVEIDLGSIYYLNKIIVWHYYGDSRFYYNTKTEVSEDGNIWYTIFDSAVSGTYTETSSGKIHIFPPRNVRYIRDWLNGNNKNSNSHWVEIMAYEAEQKTNIIIETRHSLDGGSTWTSWTECANGEPVPNLPYGTVTTAGLLECRQTLTTQDPSITPKLSNLIISVEGMENTFFMFPF